MKHTEELNTDNQGPVEDPEALARGRARLATMDAAPLQHPDATEEHAAQQRAQQANQAAMPPPLPPPGYHIDKNGKVRKDRADKNTHRAEAAPKATQAATAEREDMLIHLNLHVRLEDARLLSAIVSEEFPLYANTLQDEIIDQLSARLT